MKKSEMFKLYEEMMVLLKNTLTAIDKAYEDGKIEINRVLGFRWSFYLTPQHKGIVRLYYCFHVN